MRTFTSFLTFITLFIKIQASFSQSDSIFNYVLHDDLKYEDITSIKEKLENNVSRLLNDFELDTNSLKEFNVNIWHDKETFLNTMEKKIGYRYDYATGYIGYSDIYILYIDNPDVYINATGLLYSFTADEIAEHEFAHSLSLRINSDFSNNPRWFWEVVAIYESEEFYNPNELSYLKAGYFPTINELDSGFENGDYKIYQVGFLIGEYIVSQWGRNGFIELIKQTGNIGKVFGISETEFEFGWKKFVEEKYFNINSIEESINYDIINASYNAGLLIFTDMHKTFDEGLVELFDLNGKLVSSFRLKEYTSNYQINLTIEYGNVFIAVITCKDERFVTKIMCH